MWTPPRISRSKVKSKSEIWGILLRQEVRKGIVKYAAIKSLCHCKKLLNRMQIQKSAFKN